MAPATHENIAVFPDQVRKLDACTKGASLDVVICEDAALSFIWLNEQGPVMSTCDILPLMHTCRMCVIRGPVTAKSTGALEHGKVQNGRGEVKRNTVLNNTPIVLSEARQLNEEAIRS